MFFNKILTFAETKYGSTKLKIAELVGIIRQIANLIKISNHTIIVYIDHEAIFEIVNQTKFNSINIDKQNLKLIRASMYLFQFKLKIRHRFDKFNIISNALNKLSNKKHVLNKIVNLKNFDESLKNLEKN